MKKRTWNPKDKLKIVLEGLSGQIEISKLCQKYQINQPQYYKWRDQLLNHGQQAFEMKKTNSREQRLESEVRKLKNIIGDLTIELKKSDYEL